MDKISQVVIPKTLLPGPFDFFEDGKCARRKVAEDRIEGKVNGGQRSIPSIEKSIPHQHTVDEHGGNNRFHGGKKKFGKVFLDGAW